MKEISQHTYVNVLFFYTFVYILSLLFVFPSFLALPLSNVVVGLLSIYLIKIDLMQCFVR